MTEPRVRLRPITEADRSNITRWLQDPEVTARLAPEVDRATSEAWWTGPHADADERLWAIDAAEGDGWRHIGSCALDPREPGVAELGLLIGDKTAWGRGCGTAATSELLRIAFLGEMDLHRVCLWTRADNARAIRCYLKAGLSQEGVQREVVCREGRWTDLVLMAILRWEWEEMQASAKPGLQIRTCRLADYEAVVAVWQETGLGPRPDRGDSRADIALKLRRDPDLALVACWDGEVVGTVLGGWDGRRGWAYRLGVRPAWQRRGIATALLAELERRLLAQGCRFVNLMFFDDNEAAKMLYGKAGYDFWPGVCVAGKTLAEE